MPAFAAAALAAGCATSSTVTVTAPPATSSSAASAPAATSAPATSAPAVAPTPSVASSGGNTPAAQGAAAGCQGRYLRADVGQSQGAVGSTFQVITFTNLNNVPCTLYGYPGVSLANGTPVTQVGAAADRDRTSAPTRVTLQPQGVASVTLRIVQALNFPTSTCKPVATTWLQIYPPNNYGALYVPYKSTGCADSATHILTIGVVKPGSGG
jgi:hypothetical protein